MNAWIVTWDGTDTGLDRQEIVAAFNYRCSAETVRKSVEQLYMVLAGYSDEDKLRYAKKRAYNPYLAEISHFGTITCGHNPFLTARFVRNIRRDNNRYVWDEPNIKKMRETEKVILG